MLTRTGLTLFSVKVFATFCGLGLHNVLMYEEMVRVSARNKVAFDVLAYHASASIEDAKKLMVSRGIIYPGTRDNNFRLFL